VTLVLVGACDAAVPAANADGGLGADVEARGDADSAEADGSDAVEAVAPTWYRDIRPIVEQNCVACHSADGVAPFDLRTWETVEPNAAMIVAAVEARNMPPWSLSQDCVPVENDRTLGDDAIAVFGAWRDAGFPVGEVDEVEAPLRVSPFDALGPPDVVLTIPEAFVPDLTVPDDDVRSYLPVPVGEGRWLRASRVRPTSLRIAHHAQVELALADPTNPEEIVTIGLLAAWAPGVDGIVLPEDAPMRMPAGSVLNLSMHYSTVALSPDDVIAPDLTTVELWFLPDGTEPEFESVFVGTGARNQTIPAGEPDFDIVAEGVFEEAGTVIAAVPHMHLLGVASVLELGTADDAMCLIDASRYDYRWQAIYMFEPDSWVAIEAGTPWRLTCTYDNSASHQPVVNGVQLEPRDVPLGSATLDEMCSTPIIVRRPVEAR
jgi:hypothetical protein